jgi:hypothetical protein
MQDPARLAPPPAPVPRTAAARHAGRGDAAERGAAEGGAAADTRIPSSTDSYAAHENRHGRKTWRFHMVSATPDKTVASGSWRWPIAQLYFRYSGSAGRQ